MSMLRILCSVNLHKWRDEEDSVAKRYRHNTFWDKTTNKLDSPRAMVQTCARCGIKRMWSLNRGCWKPFTPIDPEVTDTSAAWEVVSAERDETMPTPK